MSKNGIPDFTDEIIAKVKVFWFRRESQKDC